MLDNKIFRTELIFKSSVVIVLILKTSSALILDFPCCNNRYIAIVSKISSKFILKFKCKSSKHAFPMRSQRMRIYSETTATLLRILSIVLAKLNCVRHVDCSATECRMKRIGAKISLFMKGSTTLIFTIFCVIKMVSEAIPF